MNRHVNFPREVNVVVDIIGKKLTVLFSMEKIIGDHAADILGKNSKNIDDQIIKWHLWCFNCGGSQKDISNIGDHEM